MVRSGCGGSSARFWGSTRSIRAAASLGDSSLAIWSPFRAACAQVYGGPGTARVTGELRGVRVSAEFDLTDACEIARWRRNAALLGAPGVGHGAP